MQVVGSAVECKHLSQDILEDTLADGSHKVGCCIGVRKWAGSDTVDTLGVAIHHTVQGEEEEAASAEHVRVGAVGEEGAARIPSGCDPSCSAVHHTSDGGLLIVLRGIGSDKEAVVGLQ